MRCSITDPLSETCVWNNISLLLQYLFYTPSVHGVLDCGVKAKRVTNFRSILVAWSTDVSAEFRSAYRLHCEQAAH